MYENRQTSAKRVNHWQHVLRLLCWHWRLRCLNFDFLVLSVTTCLDFFPPNRCWILVLLSSSPACICSVLRQIVPNLSLPNFTLWNSSLANISLPTSIKLELTRLISAKPNYINPISTTQDKLGMAQHLVLLWCVHGRRRTMKVFSVKSVYVKLISIEPFSIISSFANCKRLIVFKPFYESGNSF